MKIKGKLKIILFIFLVSLNSFSYCKDKVTSRELNNAIRLYEEGKDNEAMDRFMDIVIKGKPSEKNLANEYINKITLRMNGAYTDEESLTQSEVKNAEAENAKKDSSKQMDIKPVDDSSTVKTKGVSGKTLFDNKNEAKTDLKKEEKLPEQKNQISTDKVNQDIKTKEETEQTAKVEETSKKENISEKIYEKIKKMRGAIISKIIKSNLYKIYLSEENPIGLLLKEEEIFSSGVSYKQKIFGDLELVSSLIYTVGNANIMILPKGGASGEIDISSVKRAVAISTYLTSRGISPSRINLNLIGSKIKIPPEIEDTNGILLIFDYNKENNLTAEDDIKTGGPKLSLGVYPSVISPSDDDGAIIEFSIFEGSGGSPSWKFSIFREKNTKDRELIQEITGTGPKYSQTFFNGRENFLGNYYPEGKYVFSISASNSKGKENSEEKTLILKSPPSKKTNTISLKPNNAKIAKNSVIKKAKNKNLKLKNKIKKDEEEVSDEPENLNQVVYKIYFIVGKMEITPNSKKKLESIASTIDNYPDSKIEIIGYSYRTETNPKIMAKKRAEAVKKELVNKYGVDSKNIKITTIVSKTLKTIAEVKMTQE
jgi:outer membrane protein OmpA-like peptidoglycan-associated protein